MIRDLTVCTAAKVLGNGDRKPWTVAKVLGNGDRKPRTVSSCKSTERRSQRPLQYLGMNARVFVNNCERTCEFVLSHLQHSARPTAPGISLRSRLCYIDAKHLPSIDALPRERSPQYPMKMHAATFAHTVCQGTVRAMNLQHNSRHLQMARPVARFGPSTAPHHYNSTLPSHH